MLTVRRSRRSGRWSVAEPNRASYNRRVHGGTVCKLTGPAAGDARLRTAADPGGTHVRGTFGASAATLTPWGAVLVGEGRFADCFDASGPVEHAVASSFARYGLDGAGRGWSAVEERFDLAREPGEAFRFGWVVHLDPRRPTSRPRKLTMLGRLASRASTRRSTTGGRAVVRLRDAGPAGHSYGYVSRDVVDHGTGASAGRHNRRLFTTGTLHLVAPDDPDTWLPAGQRHHLARARPVGRRRAAGHPPGRPAPPGRPLTPSTVRRGASGRAGGDESAKSSRADRTGPGWSAASSALASVARATT